MSTSTNIRCINFDDLCRICTASSEHNTNIYSPDARAKNLHFKISECLGLHIDEKDRLPKVICVQCVQHVEQMYEYRNTCKNSQVMLSNCLNYGTLQNEDKVYIKDAINESGKSLSVVGNAAQFPNVLVGNGLTVQANNAQQSTDLLSTIMQAMGVQVQQQQQPQQYTITVNNNNNNNIQQSQALQPQQAEPQQPAQVKTDKHNTLEEFIRLKPDIKITPLGKKDTNSSASNVRPQTLQAVAQTQAHPQAQPTPLRGVSSVPLSTVPNLAQLQVQSPQLNEQMQQQVLLQQLQQLTTQLQAQAPNSTASVAQTGTDDIMSPSDSKKPKLNFVLSSPATPQFATALPQFGAQPQIQLQLLPSVTTPGVTMQPQQFNAAALLSSLTAPQVNSSSTNVTTNMLSPNKCFLPITIRDENSEQQIVAHIDTKNLVLPTTYQVQMKLQPQLATADGQPIMQLTPTSIPATLQLTPQTLGNAATTFQGATSTSALSNQFIAPQPQPLHHGQQQQPVTHLPSASAQVTSQQIIRSSHNSSATSPHLVKTEAITPTSQTSEITTFKTPPAQTRQQPNKSKTTPPSGSVTAPANVNASCSSNVLNITPKTEFTKRLVAQVKQQQLQHQAKHQQQQQQGVKTVTTTAPAQRLSSNTTITKVAKQQSNSSTDKMPVLIKQNITISRVPTQSSGIQQTIKPSPEPKAVTTLATSRAPQLPAMQTPKPQPEVVTTTVSIPKTSTTASIKRPIVHKAAESLIASKHRQQPQQILPVPTVTPAGGEQQEASGVGVERRTLSIYSLTCSTCGREFKKKEHLTQHVKLHAGLRPFKCTQEACDKAFSRKEHLSRHLVSHSGKKLFTCEVCKKPFSRKDNLNKHKRIHTTQPNEMLYSCDICNKSFASKTHLDKHREMHEKTVTNPNATSGSAAANKVNQYEVKQNAPSIQHIPVTQQPPAQSQIQVLQQQHQQAQIMHVQLQPTVVTTQDLAGNTITITQAPDTSLANLVQLGFPQFQNTAGQTNQLICKINK